jgi:mycothiol synthase
VDDAEFLRVNAAAFAWHPEQGRLDQQGLAAEMTQPWFDANGFFLAVPTAEPEHVLGFHWTQVHPADPPAEPEPVGEIYVLAVDPASPVKHLGGPLTAAGLAHLAGLGLRRALLYVEADNQPALRLYRRFGFTVAATDTVFA